MSQTRIAAQNRFIWVIIITNSNSVDAHQPSKAEDDKLNLFADAYNLSNFLRCESIFYFIGNKEIIKKY